MTETEGPLSSLSHALATPAQLSTSSSQLDAVPPDLESSVRFAGTQLTQAAGIALELPQEIIAQAIVLFLRFFVGPQGGSVRRWDVKDVSAASLFMTAKISAYPQSPRAVLNVYHYLLNRPPPRFQFQPSSPSPSASLSGNNKPPKQEEPLTETQYLLSRTQLFKTESTLLRTLGFSTHVILPHRLALTYLQTLGVLSSSPSSSSSSVASRTLAHLNTALFSPQLLYLTHQPHVLAVAAIYLAAREVGVKLVECDWWEIFDVDREDLGFVVVGLRSVEGWVRAEGELWGREGRGDCPVCVEGVEAEIRRREEKG